MIWALETNDPTKLVVLIEDNDTRTANRCKIIDVMELSVHWQNNPVVNVLSNLTMSEIRATVARAGLELAHPNRMYAIDQFINQDVLAQEEGLNESGEISPFDK